MDTPEAILVVDDEPKFREGLAIILEEDGYHVVTARNGQEALRILAEESVSLIITDIVMPQMNGYQLLERVRQKPTWALIPFLFLSARDLDSDIRYGKELGADDYLTKPIDHNELLASVRGKLRRAKQLIRHLQEEHETPSRANILQLGKLRIAPDQHQVWLDDKPIALSPKEFALLYQLMSHPYTVFSPIELVKTTHGIEAEAVEASSLIRPIIRSLRRKLGVPVGQLGFIENVRGVGYRILPPQ